MNNIIMCVSIYRLRTFESGVLIVQSLAHNEQAIIEGTSKLV